MKIRDVLFSALLCIFLCGPGALWAAQEKLHLDLPSWFTAEDAQYLSGGISKANVKQNLTVEGFESEQLQEYPCTSTVIKTTSKKLKTKGNVWKYERSDSAPFL